MKVQVPMQLDRCNKIDNYYSFLSKQIVWKLQSNHRFYSWAELEASNSIAQEGLQALLTLTERDDLVQIVTSDRSRKS
jgi:hypothetical protein